MKVITLPDSTRVLIRKSKRARRLTLKLTHDGLFEVTLPYVVPYYIAERFIAKHHDWIRQNKPAKEQLLTSGQQIGTQHTLLFLLNRQRLTSRVDSTTVTVSVPANLTPEDQVVQTEAKKAAIRALKRQAEAYLPTKLYALAKRYNYRYKQVQVKKMRSRWGSCSSAGRINLSIWLMQLPEHLIEYVLCHELTHLTHLNHSAEFWAELSVMVPDYKNYRRELKNYSPRLMSQQ